MKTTASLLLSAMLALDVQAASLASANYSITVETTDAGGRTASSAAYSTDSSIGGIGGTASSPNSMMTAKHGYVGQLYEVIGLGIRSSSLAVNEGSTIQLYPRAILDDDSVFLLPPEEVVWSVLEGKFSVDEGGLVTAGPSYTSHFAWAGGEYQGHFTTRFIVVMDIDPDNYPPYEGDGLPDNWQVSYFGEANPNASPSLDPDGDGQSNRYEYVADTIPTDATSRFRFEIDSTSSQPHHKVLTFSPHSLARNYTVEFTTNVVSPVSFTPLTGTTNGYVGFARQITDTNAIEAIKFYRVRISLP